MTGDDTAVILREHAALLFAYGRVSGNKTAEAEAWARMAGRGPAAVNAMLIAALDALADTIPPFSLAGKRVASATPRPFLRGTAAEALRLQLVDYVATFGPLLAEHDPDDQPQLDDDDIAKLLGGDA